MSPEVAVLVRAALVALAVLSLEALCSTRARRSTDKPGRSPVVRIRAGTQARAHMPAPASIYHSAQTQSPAPVIVRLEPLPKTPYPCDEPRAA